VAQVVLKKVNKVYPDGYHAVKDQNLTIKDGEFMVIVGPSGCAKSTTLNMIAGLEEITEGDIFIGDKRVNDIPPKDRDIAMVFQSYALYPHMNVRQNMAFGLRLRKFSKQECEKRVNEAADILGIKELLDKKPSALSGGQRQRVAVGRAIVRHPQVFLFDEPLSNLDAKLRVQMRAELIRLHKKLKTTIIYVTHDQVEAMTMGDRICILDAGVIQQVDTPLDIYQKPINKFVATFIGSPSMNILPVNLLQYGNNLSVIFVDNTTMKVSEETAQKLLPFTDKKVSFGIRPEHIFQKNEKPYQDRSLNSVVTLVEQMGNEMYVYFNCGSDEIVARMAVDPGITTGSEYSFIFDMNKCHFFDEETGKNLTY
jgi:multiple sugar transport system ATP-binding protein